MSTPTTMWADAATDAPYSWTVVESPIGPLLVEARGASISGVSFAPWSRPTQPSGDSTALAQAVSQLEEYFAGARREFSLPLAPQGTDFQRRVWTALTTIPYGSTTSYGAIAALLGLVPGASRAVGLANGRNPIPVVIPCHRVIGADGSLTGFGGGLERKRILLTLEADTLF
ncbi:MAG: methylated-DNA--[protein]-cysteine S-methyltransferase [Nocardioidaceae bacterium]